MGVNVQKLYKQENTEKKTKMLTVIFSGDKMISTFSLYFYILFKFSTIIYVTFINVKITNFTDFLITIF